MKKISLIVLMILLNSCIMFRENGIEFTIKNDSDFPIENITFTTSEKLTKKEFDKIKPNGNVSGFLSMKNNKADGCYLLNFYRSNKKVELQCYGYYTNGGSLNRFVEFKIKNDTVIQKFGNHKY